MLAAVAGSFGSKPASTPNTIAASRTVRHRMPGRSRVAEAGIRPARLIKLWVATIPTRLLFAAGLRAEGPVSSARAHITRFAATAAPEPPLERPALRVVSYGLQVTPPYVLRSPAAYSPMFALARMIAPAARRRATTSASWGGRSFA